MATRTMRLAWRLTGLAGAMALTVATVATGTLTAAAAGTSGWRIVSTVGSASSVVGTGDMVVTGPNDAWTAWTCGPCPTGTPSHANLMQHWNGKSWSLVSLPSELRYPTSIAGMGASSAQNLWVFINKARAVVFNGSRWAVKELPSWVERPIGNEDFVASAVFSAANVWAFSLEASSQPMLAGHYYAGSWHKVDLPIIPTQAIGLAPNDIWLYGFAKNYGPRTLAHWNGKSWQTVSIPHPAAGATLVASNPVALGAKSVWLLGEVFPKSGKVSFELLHWTGHWTTTAIPASVGIVDQLASDGAGGFWLITTRTQAHGTMTSQFVHDTGGHWDSLPIPTEGKLSSSPGTLASVPGSRSMWSIGFLINGVVPAFGVIMGFGQ